VLACEERRQMIKGGAMGGRDVPRKIVQKKSIFSGHLKILGEVLGAWSGRHAGRPRFSFRGRGALT
jgi:hypothetical protein